MNPHSPEFIATYWTHAGRVVPLGTAAEEASPHDFAARAEAAAAAGYCGMGFMHSDLMRIRERYSLAEMRAILESCGLVHLEFEFVVGWLEHGPAAAAASALMDDFIAAAAVLGARHIKVGPDMQGQGWPLEHMIERFAALCARAAEVGCGIALELMPWSNLRTPAAGTEVVAGAGCHNGGLLIDIWHIVRGGVPYDDVAAIPAGLIHHVELNDADADVVGSLLEDTLDRRRHCGRGAFDFPGFFRALAAQGYRGPFGIEILSAAERARPYEDVLNDAIDCARAEYRAAIADA